MLRAVHLAAGQALRTFLNVYCGHAAAGIPVWLLTVRVHRLNTGFMLDYKYEKRYQDPRMSQKHLRKLFTTEEQSTFARFHRWGHEDGEYALRQECQDGQGILGGS